MRRAFFVGGKAWGSHGAASGRRQGDKNQAAFEACSSLRKA
jgi:hypothetical protein